MIGRFEFTFGSVFFLVACLQHWSVAQSFYRHRLRVARFFTENFCFKNLRPVFKFLFQLGSADIFKKLWYDALTILLYCWNVLSVHNPHDLQLTEAGSETLSLLLEWIRGFLLLCGCGAADFVLVSLRRYSINTSWCRDARLVALSLFFICFNLSFIPLPLTKPGFIISGLVKHLVN